MSHIETYFRERYREKVKMMGAILRGDYITAEDVVQEAFTRAIKYYESFDEEKDFDKWFNSIMFNALRDVQDQSRATPTPLVEDVSAEDLFAPSWLSQNPAFRKHLESRVKSVQNPQHKDIIYLFFILGYSSKEIAEIESRISQSNVTTIVMRFRDSLEKKND